MIKDNKKAVALWYPSGSEAPFVVAKGKGFLADNITTIANENGVPIIKNDDVVEAVSIAEVGQSIPETTWQAVAAIFAFIKSTKI